MAADSTAQQTWSVEEYEEDIVLMNGRVAHLRPARPTDRLLLEALHDRASQDNIYRRFFGTSRASSHQFVARLCAPESRVHALVATLDGSLVGLASAESIAADEAEVSLFVDDRLHHVGLGSVLLERLADWQRRNGVRTMVAEVLVSNGPMLRVFGHSGHVTSSEADASVVTLRLSTDPPSLQGRLADIARTFGTSPDVGGRTD
jgi:GNAT superfamily N-acetyltransferase